ncbi:tRNA (guanosine(37)-N1)-methyltransferase TrmD [Salibacteraceae bacterium]|jgi:tRNA (guanine37-N1)-methyltransferase|nr:tRNA (guanosine(37)-N1)-methyltransferase TrmD [Salibacteraceae bacterium]
MRIDVLSAQPELLESPLNHSILKRAQDKGLLEVHLHQLRDKGLGKYNQIDDYQFGGGAGMVLRCEPIFDWIEELKSQRNYDEIIYMTPDAPVFNQSQANSLSLKENLLILCGHYKGVDQRIREELITMEISIGDYVLTGGELAAAVVCDAVVRLIPNVIGDETSALSDSFQDDLLAPPVYTRPSEYKGLSVPEILLSGNDRAIELWRMDKAIERTELIRPDLGKSRD